MEYFDETKTEEFPKGRKYVPHVIEPSIGVDRLMLAVLCSAYDEDEVSGKKRSVLESRLLAHTMHMHTRTRTRAPCTRARGRTHLCVRARTGRR